MQRDWSTIRHFKKEEWVRDPDKVLWDTVVLLDEMRHAAGVPINIHVAWDDNGHVGDSAHYTLIDEYASAVDFHFVGWSLLDQWLFAERFPWNAIGVYPFWNKPGLHVDLRRLGKTHPHLGNRWWRDAGGEYRALDKFLMYVLGKEVKT